MDEEYVILQQVANIKRYLKVVSRRIGCDIGETGSLDWIQKHAKSFRELAEEIPTECIGCCVCGSPENGKKCKHPLDPQRLRFYRREIKNKKSKKSFHFNKQNRIL